MITREYKLEIPYRVVAYLRMSTDQQNERSPDQQYDTIVQTMKRCGCPWTIQKCYRDAAMKGRYIFKRPDFMQMMADIESGALQIDLILVDTFERFGRANEIAHIRQKLANEYGIYVVSADTNFANPTGIQGAAVGMLEQFRSTEEGRIKAHNVIRGKKDALRQKRWPGAPAPFGYKLKKVVDQSSRNQDVYGVLEPDPKTGWIIQKLFKKALDTGWGGARLARWVNAEPDIAPEFKPITCSTIDRWLTNEIYIGVGVWGKHQTDIINEQRVIEPNPHPEEIVRVEGFCEALVPVNTFETIKAILEARRRGSRKAINKLIEPLGGSISVKYPLSGMVRCGHCGSAMVAHGSGRKSKTGTTYVYYACVRYSSGACVNHVYVHERRLWAAVASRLRARLFPVDSAAASVPEWFVPFVERCHGECEKLRQGQPRREADLMSQIQDLQDRMSGWRDSLGRRDLPTAVRLDLEQDYARASDEKIRLESLAAAEQARERQSEAAFRPGQVIDALRHLDQVLSGSNVTLLNMELSKHIERIECFADGRIVLRGTWIGLFEGAIALLTPPSVTVPLPTEAGVEACTSKGATVEQIRPRQLTRRKVNCLTGGREMMSVAVERSTDPNRYRELAPELKWAEVFYIARKLSWSEEHAQQVVEYKAQNPGLSLNQIAKHFGVSRPTISNVLKHGRRDQNRTPERQEMNDPPVAEPMEGDRNAAQPSSQDNGNAA